jgi:predicted GTPase
MKTEHEQLKENAQRQYVNERYEEVAQYIQGLLVEFTKAIHASQRAANFELALIATWVVTLVAGMPVLQELAFMLWVLLMLINLHGVHKRPGELDAELDGAFTTLALLGLADYHKNDKRKKRRKLRMRNPYAGLTEWWAKVKQGKRDKAFA